MQSRTLILIPCSLMLLAGIPAAGSPRTVEIIDRQTVHWDKDQAISVHADGCVTQYAEQVFLRPVRLPEIRSVDRTPRIRVKVRVTPIEAVPDRPNDPWPRLGRISLVTGDDDTDEDRIELIRFVTGFGAGGTFETDITSLAPLLTGLRRFEVFLSTFSPEPGWQISACLIYDDSKSGYRRPRMVAPLYEDDHVIAPAHRPARLTATVRIPPGLARPRVRITSTGHSTDGYGANEFVTSTHVLAIDGYEIARWRPWRERGAELRSRNPWAGRKHFGRGEVWASDLDRSGWLPGLVVEPEVIPVPELTPGEHVIELTVHGIRPPADTEDDNHGYWVISAVVIADEPLER